MRAVQRGEVDEVSATRATRNPTVAAVEQKIAALEGAEAALVLSSGQAATTTALLALVAAGDEVVCSAAIYGGTLHLLADLLPRFGIAPRFVSLEELARPETIMSEPTKLVWFESPINPTLRCVDIAAVAAALPGARRDLGHRQHVRQPDQPAADRARRRSGDAQRDEVPERPQRRHRRRAGRARRADRADSRRRGSCSARCSIRMPAYALGRGLKTLAVRVERHNANAMAVARWLAADRRVETVYYPGLETHPDHAIARRQMRGFGGMVCVDVGGGYERAARFFDRLQVFKRAASLGGVESLCSLPVLTSQWGHSDEELRARRRDPAAWRACRSGWRIRGPDRAISIRRSGPRPGTSSRQSAIARPAPSSCRPPARAGTARPSPRCAR